MASQANAEIGRGKRLAFGTIAILAVLAVVEVCAFASGKLLQKKYKMYAVPLKFIGERDPRGFFMPLRHYNADVARLLAETVYETLRARGHLPQSQSQSPSPRP
ncbi:MAG TPA: hypothetical protein VH301_06450 [Usitatibacter sp.]|nr:hypothetical protein [Usitatibacter sp.]